MRRSMRWAGVVLLGFLAAGCSAEPAFTSADVPVGTCPTLEGEARTQIDWVPFLVLDGTTYSTGYGPESELLAAQIGEQIGEQVGEITCRIAGNVDDPSFAPRDGDAAHLDPGTAVHEIVGEPVSEAVAAQQDGIWRRYRVDEGATSAN